LQVRREEEYVLRDWGSIQKVPEIYEEVPGYNNRTKFFSEFNPDYIEKSLKNYFS